MAMDEDGNILLSWAEGAGWARGGSLRWKLLDRKGNLQQSMDATQSHEIPVWSFPASVFINEKWAVVY